MYLKIIFRSIIFSKFKKTKNKVIRLKYKVYLQTWDRKKILKQGKNEKTQETTLTTQETSMSLNTIN